MATIGTSVYIKMSMMAIPWLPFIEGSTKPRGKLDKGAPFLQVVSDTTGQHRYFGRQRFPGKFSIAVISLAATKEQVLLGFFLLADTSRLVVTIKVVQEATLKWQTASEFWTHQPQDMQATHLELDLQLSRTRVLPQHVAVIALVGLRYFADLCLVAFLPGFLTHGVIVVFTLGGYQGCICSLS